VITYEAVNECLSFEIDFQIRYEEADWSDYLPIDYEATARRVWKWMKRMNILAEIKNIPEQWERDELTHLSVLDWLSMYEPTGKENKKWKLS
jgi:hypothetical protein